VSFAESAFIAKLYISDTITQFQSIACKTHLLCLFFSKSSILFNFYSTVTTKIALKENGYLPPFIFYTPLSKLSSETKTPMANAILVIWTNKQLEPGRGFLRDLNCFLLWYCKQQLKYS